MNVSCTRQESQVRTWSWLGLLVLASSCPGAIGKGSVATERKLGTLSFTVHQENQTTAAGVTPMKLVGEGRGVVTLYWDPATGRVRGTGSKNHKVVMSGPLAFSLNKTIALAPTGRVERKAGGGLASLVLTWPDDRTSPGEIKLPIPGSPTINGLKVKERVEIQTKGPKIQGHQVCESESTFKFTDECIQLDSLRNLAETMLKAFENTPPDRGETWKDWRNRVSDKVQDLLLADQRDMIGEFEKSVEQYAKEQVHSPNLEVTGVVASTEFVAGEAPFSGQPPFSIDWDVPYDQLGLGFPSKAHAVGAWLKSRHRVEIPESAWDAVLKTYEGLSPTIMENLPTDPMNRRIYEISYLKRLIEELKKQIQAKCG